jgi:hypothetical protein
MNNTPQRSALAKVINFDAWSEAEQLSFMASSGQLILDAAVNRLLLSLGESDIAKLELYLDTHGETTDVLSYLSQTYPQFDELITEEVVAFQAEAERIVSARV